jgi:hypothetical protein
LQQVNFFVHESFAKKLKSSVQKASLELMLFSNQGVEEKNILLYKGELTRGYYTDAYHFKYYTTHLELN